MSLPVFRDPELSAATVGEQLRLTGSEGRHAVTVTRLAVGERLQVGNGRGLLVTGTITAVEGKDTLELAVDAVAHSTPPTPRVIVVQSLPKHDRSELAVELATEAGADALWPYAAARSVAKWVGPKAAKGQQKWQQAALRAAKQARRPFEPPVRELLDQDQLVAEVSACVAAGGQALILHEAAAQPLARVLNPETVELLLLIGPEGGFSEEEITALRTAGAEPVLLGPEVYRTSTAAAVALGAVGVLTTRWAGSD